VTRHSRRRTVAAAFAGSALYLAAACGSGASPPVVQGPAGNAPAGNAQAREGPAGAQAFAAPDPTVVAAGDISPPRIGSQRQTSDLAIQLAPTRVLVLGDQQYPRGEISDFRRYYRPTWGRLKSKTYPVPGNHEYASAGAAGYFEYFGARARPQGRSFYSVDLGSWHIVALDSNIARSPRSAQLAWLRRDLRTTTKPCVLAFWHHPRFSSGSRHGNNPSVTPFWWELYLQHADVVLNGHEHHYERFNRQSPRGHPTYLGMREFVVGTGGNGHYPFGPAKVNSQKRIANTYGVLRLVLHPASYDWRFVAVGGAVLDRGTQRCH
jgi:hypothetical protein